VNDSTVNRRKLLGAGAAALPAIALASITPATPDTATTPPLKTYANPDSQVIAATVHGIRQLPEPWSWASWMSGAAPVAAWNEALHNVTVSRGDQEYVALVFPKAVAERLELAPAPIVEKATPPSLPEGWEPAWVEWGAESVEELAEAVAHEAWLRSAGPAFRLAHAKGELRALQLHWIQGEGAEAEAQAFSFKISYQLALTRHLAGDPETWLQAAMRLAGVQALRPEEHAAFDTQIAETWAAVHAAEGIVRSAGEINMARQAHRRALATRSTPTTLPDDATNALGREIAPVQWA
jgi:hypothetical protein